MHIKQVLLCHGPYNLYDVDGGKVPGRKGLPLSPYIRLRDEIILAQGAV